MLLEQIQTVALYITLFTSTYVQVFLLITLFELNNRVKKENDQFDTQGAYYPSVTIIVPCYNEEKTVDGTIRSLLNLDYPRKKLKIIVVDDGSKDSTWSYIQRYRNHPQISIYTKENGGKYTALNFGIKKAKTDLVGCLDADSFVDSQALHYMVRHFKNSAAMAVTPAVKIYKPQSIIQAIQYIEYQVGIVIKKLHALLNAIHVTPGPFTIFRREVFSIVGPFRHAHNTEDMEIALRMHIHKLKIENCHYASVYTVGPKTLKALYKQRVRWNHGFLENILDYKRLFFNPNYGNISWFTLPSATLSVFAVLIILGFFLYTFIQQAFRFIDQIRTVGFHFTWDFTFTWFYLNTQTSFLVTSFLLLLTLVFILQGHKLSEGTYRLRKEVFYFLFLYPYIAPLWVITSMYNTVLKRKSTWR